MKKIIQLSVLSLALVGFSTALVGCGAQSGKTVVKYDDSQTSQVQPAIETGVYALYGSRDLEPLRQVKLEEGEDIGFRTAEDGEGVIAVFGDDEIELDQELLSTYRWKLQK